VLLYALSLAINKYASYIYGLKRNKMPFHPVITQLKTRREMMQVTQQTLAEIAGVGLRTLKQIETGKGNPQLQTLQNLADALGMQLKLELKKTKEVK